MTSLTRTAHGSVPGSRQGRSRAAPAYQSTMTSPTGCPGPGPASGPAAAGSAVLTRPVCLRLREDPERTVPAPWVTGQGASGDTPRDLRGRARGGRAWRAGRWPERRLASIRAPPGRPAAHRRLLAAAVARARRDRRRPGGRVAGGG